MGKPAVRIHAQLCQIPTRLLSSQHKVNPDQVLEMFKATKGHKWPFSPILACYQNGVFEIYDGHHRSALAKIQERGFVPAYGFFRAELDAVVARYFDGTIPEELYALDRYIVLPDGSPYSPLRDFGPTD